MSQAFVADGTDLAMAEMIRGGTTCFNDMYFFPDVVADRGIHLTAFERLGIPQVYAGFGEDEQLRDKHGYGLSATVSALRRALAAR